MTESFIILLFSLVFLVLLQNFCSLEMSSRSIGGFLINQLFTYLTFSLLFCIISRDFDVLFPFFLDFYLIVIRI